MQAGMDARGVEGPRVNSNFNPGIIDLGRIEGRVEKSLIGKVRKLVDEFPDQALMVIRGWMAQRV